MSEQLHPFIIHISTKSWKRIHVTIAHLCKFSKNVFIFGKCINENSPTYGPGKSLSLKCLGLNPQSGEGKYKKSVSHYPASIVSSVQKQLGQGDDAVTAPSLPMAKLTSMQRTWPIGRRLSSHLLPVCIASSSLAWVQGFYFLLKHLYTYSESDNMFLLSMWSLWGLAIK